MAVPKKRTTSSRQGARRSHLAISPAQLVTTASGARVPRRLKKASELGLLKSVKKA